MKYWFKPKRAVGKIAAYYPVSWLGWLITFATIAFLVYEYKSIDARSFSFSDTLIMFTPIFLGTLLIFDILNRLTGEYPSWWKRWNRKNRG